MSQSSLSLCRVVLVRPHFAGNLGSIARVMKNFGLRELVLVDPIAEPDAKDAVMMAVHAGELLTNSRRVSTLAEAVADCGYVVATSGEVGGLIRKDYWGTPEEKMPLLLDAMQQTPVAIVFGPEPHGLMVDEIAACHGMISIPTDDSYPSMNLAQSVTVCLYELRRQWLHRGPIRVEREPSATYEEQEHFYRHFKEALFAIRYLWDSRADGLFHVMRNVVARTLPTRKELKVLHALAAQLLFVAKTWGVPHPNEHPHTRELKKATKHDNKE